MQKVNRQALSHQGADGALHSSSATSPRWGLFPGTPNPHPLAFVERQQEAPLNRGLPPDGDLVSLRSHGVLRSPSWCSSSCAWSDLSESTISLSARHSPGILHLRRLKLQSSKTSLGGGREPWCGPLGIDGTLGQGDLEAALSAQFSVTG